MRVAASLALVLIVTAAAYAGVAGHDFIVVDDGTYVFMNPWVMKGLSMPGVVWSFTTFEAFNWHPLTWLSHMTDVTLVGADPGPQHLVNVGYHLFDTVLLFVALRSLTARAWESLLVAALFALHPMHVESVAWIAERKDVLSACFWFLALWAYSAYAARPGVARYLLVALAMSAGLLAKPMVVTLPMVLLLLDVWPLERARWTDLRRLAWLVLEKVPLLALSAASSVVTMIAQQPGVGFEAESLPWSTRAGNALVAYVSYLRLTFWPDALAAFYPHPGWVSIGAAACAGALLLGITAAAIWMRDRRPYLLVGWLWFLGTLVPVIGVVQVGDQAMADRYTYVPHVGLFLMIAWSAADLARGNAIRRATVVAASVVALLALAITTRAQVMRWKNTETLFEYTLSVTPKNAFAHFGLATVFLAEDRPEEARRQVLATLEADPNHPEALNALGNFALQAGDEDEALRLYRRAAKLGWWEFEPQLNAALLLHSRGDLDAALPFYRAAARLEPYHAGIQLQMAKLLEEKGMLRLAAQHYRRASRLDPELSEAREGLSRVRARVSEKRGRAGQSPKAGAPGGSM